MTTRVFLLVAMLLGAWVEASWAQPKPRVVERAKRPQFSERDWEGVYFQDLFREGLVGPRPQHFGAKPPVAVAQPSNDNGPAPGGAADSWSALISPGAIEDEIKRLHLELDPLVTTPQAFKTDNTKIRYLFHRLATLFAIISQYDETVRWKDDAPAVRDGLAQAAANARTSSEAAFANAKAQRDRLSELVRGGKWSEITEGSVAELDWPLWAERSAVMQRLEAGFDERLKPWTSSAAEFAQHPDEILHEAQMASALGRVLVQTGMPDAEDDEYMTQARQMSNAGLELRKALEASDWESASSAVNKIGQSCTNCHESYR
jgi:hypothetical protein